MDRPAPLAKAEGVDAAGKATAETFDGSPITGWAAQHPRLFLAQSRDGSCEASVDVSSIDGGGGSWEIVFDVETDVGSSGGRFEFEVHIEDENGPVQSIVKTEAWDVTHAQEFEIVHQMSLGKDEAISDVDVNDSSVECRVP